MASAPKYWLMKAEPDSRIVKGKDVKFSVDDFEKVQTTPWEGVRNHEAKNLMKSMTIGDQVLFYHSNCKSPGIAGFAEVSKGAYPDYTAWDSSHPYFDAKSDKDSPKWFMVDLTFKARAAHFVPLSLLRQIAGASTPPSEVEYIGEEGLKSIKDMALVNRGRLSVQKVEAGAWDAIKALADKGGWKDEPKPKRVPKTPAKPKEAGIAPAKAGRREKVTPKTAQDEDDEAEVEAVLKSEAEQEEAEPVKVAAEKGSKKRKIDKVEEPESPPVRRSTRVRKPTVQHDQ